jgi:hypothetical protein
MNDRVELWSEPIRDRACPIGLLAGIDAPQHLKSLRHMSDDHGWIRVLMDEAENVRGATRCEGLTAG